ncbi:hypothetical protein H0H92_001560 [Tricholoma furcatifolium]|nr:hypothetical protein H0H92_001560 [Tricholoma furcatifolium]
MPRLLINPNEVECPDFNSEDYAQARADLISDTVDNETAIVTLVAAWNASNRAERAMWERQVQADAEIAATREQESRDRRDQHEADRRLEEEVAKTEDQKKNRSKYLELADVPPPVTPPEIFPTYATTRLQKGQYVELWYFTNEGIAHGMKTAQTVNENAMVQSIEADGSVTWTPAAALRTASREVKPDCDLSWEQFLVAYPRFLDEIEVADWTVQRRDMMRTLFQRLQAHPLRFTKEQTDRWALLRYLCEQHQLWHRAIDTPTRGWNIGVISETLLRHAVEEIRGEEATKREQDRDNFVSGDFHNYEQQLIVSLS